MAGSAGKTRGCTRPTSTRPSPSSTPWTCSPTLRAPGCTWGTARATPPRTSSRAGSGCRAGTCCTRWAGTPSACRPRTTPSRPASTRASPPRRPSPTSGGRSTAVGFAYDWDREVNTTDPALLQVDAVDLPAAVPQGPGLRGHGPHQLVPVVQDRAGQRGGQPGPLRALRDRRSSARTCGSGCCASPATPTACWRIWPRSTGPSRRWPCSATGSAAPRGRRSRSRWPAPAAARRRRDPGVHHPAGHAVRRDLHGAGARAPAGGQADHARPGAAVVAAYQDAGAQARATSSAPIWPRRRPAPSPAATPSTRSTASRSRSGSPTTC